MVYHQLYLKKKGTKRWSKWGYPKPYDMVKAEWRAYKKSKKYKDYDVKMKRAY